MFLGIDHLVIAVADVDDAAAQLERDLGLAATGGGRHDALGTRNRLVWLGDTYVELITVFDRPLAERSWIGGPTVRALDAGGGLAAWAIATDDLERDLAELWATGSDLGDPIAGERRRIDGAIVRWRVATPPVLGPFEPPFLIEHDGASAEWRPTDRAARKALHHPLGGSVTLEAVELAVNEVNVATERLGRTVGLRFRPSLAGGRARDSNVGSQIVRVGPRAAGSGTAVIRLAAPVAEERVGELLGCRWVVRPNH